MKENKKCKFIKHNKKLFSIAIGMIASILSASIVSGSTNYGKNNNSVIYNHKYKVVATNDDNTDENHFESIYNEGDPKNVIISKKVNKKEQVNLLRNLNLDKESIFKVDIDEIPSPNDKKNGAFTLKDLQDKTQDENFETYSSTYAIWKNNTKNGDVVKEFNLKNSSNRGIHSQLKWVQNKDKTWNLQLVYDKQESGGGEDDSIYRYKVELTSKILNYNEKSKVVATNNDNDGKNTKFKEINIEIDPKYVIVLKEFGTKEQVDLLKDLNFDTNKPSYFEVNIKKTKNTYFSNWYRPFNLEDIFKRIFFRSRLFYGNNIEQHKKTFIKWDPSYEGQKSIIIYKDLIQDNKNQNMELEIKWVKNNDHKWSLKLEYPSLANIKGESESIYIYDVRHIDSVSNTQIQQANLNESNSKIAKVTNKTAQAPTKKGNFELGSIPKETNFNVPTQAGLTFTFNKATPVDENGKSQVTYTVDTKPKVDGAITKNVTWNIHVFETKAQVDANRKIQEVTNETAQAPTKKGEAKFGSMPEKTNFNVPTQAGFTFTFNKATPVDENGKSQVTYLVNVDPIVIETTTKKLTFTVEGFETRVQADANRKIQEVTNETAQAPTKKGEAKFGSTPKKTNFNVPTQAGFTFTFNKATWVDEEGKSQVTYLVDVDPSVDGTTPKELTFTVEGFETKAQFEAEALQDAKDKVKEFINGLKYQAQDDANHDSNLFGKINQVIRNYNSDIYNHKSKLVATNDDNTYKNHFKSIYNEDDQKNVFISKQLNTKEQVDLLRNLNFDKESIFKVNIEQIQSPNDKKNGAFTLKDLQDKTQDENFETYDSTYVIWEKDTKNGDVAKEFNLKNSSDRDIYAQIKWVQNEDKTWNLQLVYDKQEGGKGEDDSIYRYKAQPIIISFYEAQAFVKKIQIPNKNKEFNEQELFNKITKAKEEAQKIINQARENEDIARLTIAIYKINKTIKNYNDTIYNHKSKVVATNDDNGFKRIIFDETDPKYVIVLKKWRESEQVDLLKNVKLNENKINYFSLNIKKVKNKIVEYSYPDGKDIVSSNPFTASYIKKRIISQDNMVAQENTLIKWDPSYRTKKSIIVYMNTIKNVEGRDIKLQIRWVKSENNKWSLKLEYFKFQEDFLEDDSIYIYDVKPIITFDEAKVFIKNIQIPTKNNEFNEQELFNKITKAKEESQKIMNQAKENDDITPLMQVIYRINHAIKDYNDAIYNHKYKVVTTNDRGKTHFEEINNESNPKYVIVLKKWRELEQVDLLKNVKFDQKFAYFKIDIQKLKNDSIIWNNPFTLNNILSMISPKNIENIKTIFLKWDPSYKNIDFINLYREAASEYNHSKIRRKIKWVKTSNKSWSLKLYYSPLKPKDDSIYIYKISKINESDSPDFLNDDTYNKKIKIVATTDDSSHVPFNILGEINTHGEKQNKYVISLKEWGKREQIDLLRGLTFSKNESKYFSINIQKVKDEEIEKRLFWQRGIDQVWAKMYPSEEKTEDLKTIFIKWEPSYMNKKSIVVYTDSIKSASKHNIKLKIKWVKVGINKYSLNLEYSYFDQNGGKGEDNSIYIYDAKKMSRQMVIKLKKIAEAKAEINKITSQIKLIKGAKEPKGQKNKFENAIKAAKRTIGAVEQETIIQSTLNTQKELVTKARDEYENAIKVANENKKAADLKVAQDKAKKLINSLIYPDQKNDKHDASLLAKIEEAKKDALIAIKNAKTPEEVDAIASSPTVGTKLKKVKNAIDDYNKSTAKDKGSVKTKKAKKNKTTIIIVSTLSSIGGLALIVGIAYWVKKSKINNLKKK